MASDRTRERIIELIREMQKRTIANGCTPAEAAGFSAKIDEWVERYQIEDIEIKGGDPADAEIEVCQHKLRTGKRAFNPGVTRVVAGLAEGMCCKYILLHEGGEAVYGVVGEVTSATIVCQLVATVVPALKFMAVLDGTEAGEEGAGLIRWSNQYLTGAGFEIKKRLEAERKARTDAKVAASPNALILVTGETLALAKREASADVFKSLYPKTRTTYSRSAYNEEAQAAGREAGKRVGLRVALEE